MKSDELHRPERSPGSSLSRPKRLRPAGGYRKTASFQTATIIYDATCWFGEKFLDSSSRTIGHDQQIAALERAFIEDGGYSEQLATARLVHRARPRDSLHALPGMQGKSRV